MSTLDNTRGRLGEAESLVGRARLVSGALFKEAKRMPEYKRILATRERCSQFEKKLLKVAQWIDGRLATQLPDDVLKEVVMRLSRRIAIWEHAPSCQRERQKKQVAKRRRGNRGRDQRIVRLHEDGESQRRIAEKLEISRGAVEKVLRRHRLSQAERRRR